jgi:DNA-binding winged helix-turn-helix (wHTH) protein
VPPPEQLVYEAGALEIDAGRRELRARGTQVPIGSRAFEIIEALAQCAAQLVSKDHLMARTWPSAVVGESTIQVHISAIRKALGPDRAVLQTTSGRGYSLLGRWRTKPREASKSPVELVPARVSAGPLSGNLPVTPAVLIGRDATLQHLRDLMSAYRIVTLTGPGGIGKTRLALEIARTLAPAFGGAVRLVELGSLPDASLVAAAVASVLGLQPGGSDVSATALARAIGGRRLLLVIDNCEHVIDAADGVVEAIVRLCPEVSVLATSRKHMRIEGESAFRVPPLDYTVLHGPERGPSGVLEGSAVQLFITRMAELRSGDQRQNDLSTIASICRRLDGIPLAIEFAAARAATLGVTEVLPRLDDRFEHYAPRWTGATSFCLSPNEFCCGVWAFSRLRFRWRPRLS